ncbi:MAG: PQQ-dependent sugar dehydrogenase [Phycisphaeraceae bacterium]|nr:MAG: PQQ-dependent sugar dehydrogenase [Phycisphaeraceae bacterium]
MRTTLIAVAGIVALTPAAIGLPNDEPRATISSKPPSEMSKIAYTVETVATGLQVPWDLAFLPDGRIFVSERPGRVRVIKDGALLPEPALTLKVWKQPAENGLMGLCLHPAFAENRWVYLAYGSRDDNDVRVVRYTERDGVLVEPRVIVSGMPAGANHAGCRVRFGPDGKLYITTGERFDRDLAQDLTSLGGKILRVNDDGSSPEDNPFNTPEHRAKGVRPEVWVYGCRNPQGLDWQPGTGRLFQVEHGPSGEAGFAGDEFNLIEKGKNYGWPEIHHAQTRDGMVSPLIEWSPTVAPSAAAFYNADLFPELKGSFLVTTLLGTRMIRVELDGDRVVRQECLVKGLGRLRAVTVAPDGSIYFATSNRDSRGQPARDDDRILRLVPGTKP